ncbi:MAG: hypothetical protein AAGN82_25050 [Myxococcota bacterium]
MDPAEIGPLIDIALVAIVVEIAVLLVYRRVTGRGLRPLDLLGHLLAGGFLLGAVRAAVSGADTGVVLTLVTASLPTHLFDLVRRVRATKD